MGRIRTVKPEFNSNEGLSSLSAQAHLMAEALLCYADDEGFFNANPALVRAGTCPLRKDFKNIDKILKELVSIKYLRFGEYRGKRYGQIVKFKDHQKISHPTTSKIGKLNILWENSLENSGVSPEITGVPPEMIGEAPEILRPEQGTGKGTGNREQGRAVPAGNREKGIGTRNPEEDVPVNGEAAGIDANMMARGLCERLNLSRGMGKGTVYEAVYDLALQEEKRGGELEMFCERLAAAYELYLRESPQLEYNWGPAKFFAEGHWQHPELWPRKGREAPKIRILDRPGG